jgi:hypothetical protein
MGRREAAARTAHVRAVLTRAATGKGRSVTEILLAAYAGERNARRSVDSRVVRCGPLWGFYR